MKQRFLKWLFTRAGIQAGDILPTWARILLCVLMPSYITACLAAKVYDFRTDTYYLDGVRIAREAFTCLGRTPLPSQWFRVIKRENGVITLETRHEETEP